MNDLATLVAEREIGRALVCFARAMDSRAWDELLELMAPDATGDLGTGPLNSAQQIIDCMRHYLDVCGPTQHLLGNLLIETHGDQARSQCYVSDMHLGRSGRDHLTFATLGDYHDRWQRREGRWLMVHRTKINHATIGTFEVFDIKR